MTLNTADRVYLGTSPVDKVYMGGTQIYPAQTGVTYIERFNMFPQPSIELALSSNWNSKAGAANGTISVSTDMAYRGTSSLKFTGAKATAATLWQHYGLTKAGMPATPGRIYRLSYHVRCDTVLRNSFMGVFWYDSTGAQISFVTKLAQVNGAVGIWNEAVGTTDPAPDGTVYMGVRFNVAGILLDEMHYFDAIAVEDVTDAVPARVYFDGDSTGSAKVIYSWMGTPHSSVSRERIDQSAVATYSKNLVPNPSFETNVAGWFKGNGTIIATDSTLPAAFGSQCLYHEATNNDVNTWTGIGQFPVTPSTTYTMSAYFRAKTVARDITLNMDGWDDLNYTTWTGGFSTPQTGETVGAWTRLSWTFTTPPGTFYADLYFGWNATVTGEIHYMDAAMLQESSVLNPYFDGSSPATGDTAYSWDGVAHASASTKATLS